MRKLLLTGITTGLILTLACTQNDSENQDSSENTPIESKDDVQQQESMPSPQTLPKTAEPDKKAEISDKELQQFAEAAQAVQEINQSAQQEIMSEIQKSGLSIQRFNEINQAQKNPDVEVEATDNELTKAQSVSAKIQEIQAPAVEKMKEKIQAVGLDETRYKEIAMTVQSDPALQNKLQTIQNQMN